MWNDHPKLLSFHSTNWFLREGKLQPKHWLYCLLIPVSHAVSLDTNISYWAQIWSCFWNFFSKLVCIPSIWFLSIPVLCATTISGMRKKVARNAVLLELFPVARTTDKAVFDQRSKVIDSKPWELRCIVLWGAHDMFAIVATSLGFRLTVHWHCYQYVHACVCDAWFGSWLRGNASWMEHCWDVVRFMKVWNHSRTGWIMLRPHSPSRNLSALIARHSSHSSKCKRYVTIQGGPKKTAHYILLSISLLNIDRFS